MCLIIIILYYETLLSLFVNILRNKSFAFEMPFDPKKGSIVVKIAGFILSLVQMNLG